MQSYNKMLSYKKFATVTIIVGISVLLIALIIIALTNKNNNQAGTTPLNNNETQQPNQNGSSNTPSNPNTPTKATNEIQAITLNDTIVKVDKSYTQASTIQESTRSAYLPLVRYTRNLPDGRLENFFLNSFTLQERVSIKTYCLDYTHVARTNIIREDTGTIQGKTYVRATFTANSGGFVGQTTCFVNGRTLYALLVNQKVPTDKTPNDYINDITNTSNNILSGFQLPELSQAEYEDAVRMGYEKQQ